MTRNHTEVDEYGHPLNYDPDFNGPLKHRSCTDIICLLLFFVFIGCWVGVGIYAFHSGNPNLLLVPKDTWGGRCGLDEHLKNKPYLFFFDLTQCIKPTVPFTGCPTLQICVEKCPEENFNWESQQDSSKLICEDGYPQNAQSVKDGKCARWYLKSSPLLNRCLYVGEDQQNIRGSDSETVALIKTHLSTVSLWMSILARNFFNLATDNQQWQQVGQNIVDDLIASWWKILTGIGIGVVSCIIYIFLMRWIAGIMVWTSLIGILALLSGSVYYTAKQYIDLKDQVNQNTGEHQSMLDSYLTNRDTWLVLLIISSVVLGIILLILIFLRKRILLAIALIREGSKAVSSVTSVLFFPIFPWIFQLGVIGFTVAVALYLSTTGEPIYQIREMIKECCEGNAVSYKNGVDCHPETFKNNCQKCESQVKCKFIGLDNPKHYGYLQAINVFGFFWGTFFVSAFGQMVLASVFATWYWTYRKSNLPFFAVTEATLRTFRYHIGTLAFGSLIITICRIIRVFLEYCDQQLKKYENPVTKALLCCCKCFFWCLEKFLKFINRNAYIMCAIHGKNFCASAKDAFLLLMRNIVRVFVLDKVTDFLFFLSKLLVTVGIGAIAYMIFATDLTKIDNSGLNYPVVPIIVIMISTYFVATIFFNVYSMAVDTLFLCFLEDCERNDGSTEKPYYMSRNLMKIFGKKNKKH